MPTFSFPAAPPNLTIQLQRHWNAPLPIHFTVESIASVICFMPDYYPCTIARLVSCYALFKCDGTAVWFEPTLKQAEQRGLSVTVSTDDADAVALIDTDGDGIKNDSSRKLEVKILRAEKVSH
jgi:hypothetical protein